MTSSCLKIQKVFVKSILLLYSYAVIPVRHNQVPRSPNIYSHCMTMITTHTLPPNHCDYKIRIIRKCDPFWTSTCSKVSKAVCNNMEWRLQVSTSNSVHKCEYLTSFILQPRDDLNTLPPMAIKERRLHTIAIHIGDRYRTPRVVMNDQKVLNILIKVSVWRLIFVHWSFVSEPY